MKQITEELYFKIWKSHTGGFGERAKWNEIFDTEEELIKALFHEKVLTDEDKVPMYKWCRGYEFIKGLRKYYNKNMSLTPKQMTQLKRLAPEIAYQIYCTR